MTMNN